MTLSKVVRLEKTIFIVPILVKVCAQRERERECENKKTLRARKFKGNRDNIVGKDLEREKERKKEIKKERKEERKKERKKEKRKRRKK